MVGVQAPPWKKDPFSTFQLAALRLKNRLATAPLARSRASFSAEQVAGKSWVASAVHQDGTQMAQTFGGNRVAIRILPYGGSNLSRP
jgi:2,4-dienoyl-CoA reductase-like NADH-dependent reductase (Old Yellow Enzyme family)